MYADKDPNKASMKRKDPEDLQIQSRDLCFPALGDKKASKDPLIIQAQIFDISVRKVYIDNGSECDIIYEHCFLQLPEAVKARMTNLTGPLAGFARNRVWPLREIDLDVTLGNPPFARTETLDFTVVRAPSLYNLLLGRPAIQRMEMVLSTVHAMVLFQTKSGVGMIKLSYDLTKQISEVKKSKEEPEEVEDTQPERSGSG
uniref:uncharacterized protein LOC122591205 n=1 Tax=Erigeron canadensis TaxID=72917 RepID=UPI001CB9B0DB|nr:uncharacterized protein LOC122591205 [Erigeron canadensis]